MRGGPRRRFLAQPGARSKVGSEEMQIHRYVAWSTGDQPGEPECRDARLGCPGWPARDKPLFRFGRASCEPSPEGQLPWEHSLLIILILTVHLSIPHCISSFSTRGLPHKSCNASSEARKFHKVKFRGASTPGCAALTLSGAVVPQPAGETGYGQELAPAGLLRSQWPGCRAGSLEHLLATLWGAALQRRHRRPRQPSLPQLQMPISFCP